MHLDLWVLIAGIVMTIAGLALAGKRVVFLFRLITSGQPAPERIAGVTGKLGQTLKVQLVEVFGQKKLLKWSIPGTAHFFVFWAFLILGTVYLEAFVALFARQLSPHLLFFGNFGPLGLLQDFIAVMCLGGIIAFYQIRMKNAPAKLGRNSRFSGSHLGGAYFVLFMIFNVLWTLFLFRGAVEAHDMAVESATGADQGYGKWAFVSYGLGKILPDSNVLIGIGLLLHIGIMLVFLVDVVNSKHLHIFIAPLNVAFGRRPVALGAVKPLISAGKPITMDDLDDLDEDTKLGIGSIEDFSWKGLLDMATCTECGRCQSQCPAWNTEKPLSPKMLILNLRDHAFATGDYLIADEAGREKMLANDPELAKEVARPLIGDEAAYGVIDPDVLWSCVNCGACVNQCPVDIEHVDHIADMRRYQVLVENNFPAELNGLFKGMEGKGNPWNLSASARLDWAKDLPFEVKVVGESIESLDEVDWLFWVGCAGAYEDRAKKTTRAVAELLDMAGVSFGVLGNGETCTGDSARRAGNEFLFQGLAQQNVETFKEFKVKKVVSTCAHCFNTLKNEYTEFGIELEVVHHTQLLNKLVRDGKLTPVADGAGAHKRSITYHDPCFIGRHNGVYSPPRELLQVLPGAQFVEMERNSERSFCCGAGGARMWMEEKIGSRINENRTDEAVGTGADQIAVGCPFCRVMLSDGLTNSQAKGVAREEVEVLDVAQMLLAAVKGESATRYLPGEGPSTTEGSSAPTAKAADSVSPEADQADVTLTEDTVTETADGGTSKATVHDGSPGGSSLFDNPGSMFDEPVAKKAPATTDPDKAPTEEAKAAKPASSGGSLFDLGNSTEGDTVTASSSEVAEKSVTEATGKSATPSVDAGLGSGGSLFDLGASTETPAETGADTSPAPASSEPEAARREPVTTDAGAEKAESAPAATAAPAPAADLGAGGSLFDIPASAPASAPSKPAAEKPAPAKVEEPKVEEPKAEPVVEAPKAETPKPAAAKPAVDLSSGGSLFDIAAPEPVASAPKASAPAAEPEAAATATADMKVEADAETKADTTAAEPGTLAGGAALSAAATSAAGDEPAAPADAGAPAEPDVEALPDESASDDEPAAAVEADEKLDAATGSEPAAEKPTAPTTPTAPAAPKASSNGEAHQPKTDADISSAGSLFDL